jgi:hypothetical protein
MEFLGMPSDRVTIPENINSTCNKRFQRVEKPRNINNISSTICNCAKFQ